MAEALERHGDYVKGDTLTDSLEIVTADALASVTAEGEAVSPVQELDLNGHRPSIRCSDCQGKAA